MLVALVFPTVLAVGIMTAPTGPVEAVPVQIDIATPGPFGAVTVIGDSVLLGSALVGPTLADRLSEQGWGPIRMRAGEGYTSGRFDVRESFRTTYWLGLWRSQGWDAPNVIVNIGANDSGLCDTDLACARESILHVVNDIGPGHRIWWPQITRFYTHFSQQDNWNTALAQIAAERDDFFTWDWPSELPQYASADGTHLSPDGYRVRSARMAEVFTRVVAAGSDDGTSAELPDPFAPASSFVPLPADRLVDTRLDDSVRASKGATLRIDLGDRVPAGTTAVAVYVAAMRASEPGFLSAGPCGSRNEAATVNYDGGSARGAPAIVAVGAGDDLCIATSGPTDVTVDLQGAFVAGDEGLRLDALEKPDRLVDTRDEGRARELTIPVPPDADAVAVNLAAVKPADVGFLAAYPCGSPSTIANVNYAPGPPVAGSAIVNVSDDDTICVSASAPTDVVVDITGTFGDGEGAGQGLAFVPVLPSRTLDTRFGIGGWSPAHGARQVIDARVAPPGAAAVTGTLTVVRPRDEVFVTGFPCVGEPPTASVNAGVDGIAANSLTNAITADGDLCFSSSALTTTVFDTTGWWVR